MTKKPPLVAITHGNCIDGFTAAWALWTYFGPRLEIHQEVYGREALKPSVWEGADVIMADFSYPRPVMKQIAKGAARLRVFDHHASSQADLEGLEEELRADGIHAEINFDLNRSGAGLVWDCLMKGIQRPWLVSYVEDRDLWRFRLRNSKQVNAYIGSVDHSFKSWDALAALNLKDVFDRGEGAAAFQDEYVRRVLADMRPTFFQGHTAMVVNAHYKSISEVLNAILENHPDIQVAIGWYQRKDGLFQYSLRSRKDGPRVDELAVEFGGGGHPNSAGFTQQEMKRWLPRILK